MASVSFDQIWEAAHGLDVEQIERLRNLLEALLTIPALRADPATLPAQYQVDLALMKEGAMSRIPAPPTEEDIRRFREWKPVPIQGKPLSETIIEDRR
jgi:hypothetical protein